ncbi:MAG TPA: virulence factor MviN, partial [Streptomyces sp.]|nr:virulence factor MviN [Streptomyces sp.]
MTDTHASRTPHGAPPTTGKGGESPRLGRFLVRAAVITAAFTAAGSLFGLLRDQAIAGLFGADADTDAFL